MATAAKKDPNVFILPDLGEGVHEAELISWKVEPGRAVDEHEIIAEMETDKALVEVPSPRTGVIQTLHGEPGQILKVGEPLVTYAAGSGEVVEAAEAAEDGTPDEASPAAASAPAASVSPNGAPRVQPPEAEQAAGSEGQAAESEGQADEAERASDDQGTVVGQMNEAMAGMSTGPGRVLAAPAVRRLARDLGVDLEQAKGTGIGGRVTAKDVRALAQAKGKTTGSGTLQDHDKDGKPPVDPTRRVAPLAQQPVPSPASPSAASAWGVQPAGWPGVGTAGGVGGGQSGAPVQPRPVAPVPGQPAAPSHAPTPALGWSTSGHQGFMPSGPAGPAPAPWPSFPPATPFGHAAYAQPLPQQPEAPIPDPAQTSHVNPGEAEARLPFRGVRRTIAQRLRESVNTAVHFTAMDEADVTALDAYRQRLIYETGRKISFLPFVCAAVCRALSPRVGGRFGALNARVDEQAQEIVQHAAVHLGIATDTESGLMVPVIRDADLMDPMRLADEIAAAASSARDRTIPRDRLGGSTFTITNVGSYAGRFATPVINSPEVSILAVGRVYDGVIVRHGQPVVARLMPLSLGCDHRVIDGATGALALAEIKRLLGGG